MPLLIVTQNHLSCYVYSAYTIVPSAPIDSESVEKVPRFPRIFGTLLAKWFQNIGGETIFPPCLQILGGQRPLVRPFSSEWYLPLLCLIFGLIQLISNSNPVASKTEAKYSHVKMLSATQNSFIVVPGSKIG